MTDPTDRQRPDLSPSAARSLRTLLHRRGTTWREAIDGSVVGALAGVGSALVLVKLVRRRRT